MLEQIVAEPRPRGRPAGITGKDRPGGEEVKFCGFMAPARTLSYLDTFRVKYGWNRSRALRELLNRVFATEFPADFVPAASSEPQRRPGGKYRTRNVVRDKELIEAYVAGATVAELCERYDLRPPSVYSI